MHYSRHEGYSVNKTDQIPVFIEPTFYLGAEGSRKSICKLHSILEGDKCYGEK